MGHRFIAMHQGKLPDAFAEPLPYDRHTEWLTRRLYATVVADARSAGLREGARVLDVGTGPGRLPATLAQAEPGWVLDGIDIDPKMIEFARRRPGAERVTFTVADVAALPFPDGTFDLIVSTLSQHHWPDVPAGLRDLRRVLRPGGRLYIYDAVFTLRKTQEQAKNIFNPYWVRRESARTPTRLFSRLAATRAPESHVDSIAG